MDRFGRVYGWLMLCFGSWAVVYCIVSVFRTRKFIRNGVGANGEVVRLEHSTDQLGNTSYESYAPVFTFTARDGVEYRVTSAISSSPADFSVGEYVRVRYDPANPQEARIETLFETWGLAIIAGAVGLLFVGCSCKLLGLLHLAN